LRIVTCNPNTIGRLVHASLLRQDLQDSIGIDYDHGDFLIVKAIHDMKIILEYLTTTRSTATNSVKNKFMDGGDFQVF
jgi:hypothetical protein